jgi:hypothetical protein
VRLRTFGRVAEFLVELYVSRTEAVLAARGTERARLAADELTAQGTPARLVRSLFVPEDETCFLLIQAASIEVVREAARRAGLSFERVSETLLRPDEETLSCA